MNQQLIVTDVKHFLDDNGIPTEHIELRGTMPVARPDWQRKGFLMEEIPPTPIPLDIDVLARPARMSVTMPEGGLKPLDLEAPLYLFADPQYIGQGIRLDPNSNCYVLVEDDAE